MNCKYKVVFSAVALFISGCAGQSLEQKTKDQIGAYVDRFKDDHAVKSTVTETDRPYVSAEAVEYRPTLRGGVNLNLNAVPLRLALASALSHTGYEVSYVGKVEPLRPVTLSVTNQEYERAVKDLAFAAGYIAIFDHGSKRVMITDEATYTYRIDPHSIEVRKDDYTTTANPGGSSSSGSGSGSGGGSSSSSSSSSGSSSSGGDSSAVATSTRVTLGPSNKGGPEEFLGTIRSMVGAGAKGQTVNYVSLTGMLIVRGNAAELRRVTDFVDLHQRDARTQVDLEAAIIEVTLTNDFQFGIDWSRVVPLSGGIGGQAAISLTDRGLVPSPAVTANITTNSVSAVIKALQEKTNVNVVAEPHVTALNHRDGYYMNATQRPYVPEIDQTTVQNAGTTSSGKLAYIPDGLSFAFKPAVMGPNIVRARILPVNTTVGDQHQFQLGQAQLTGYDVSVSQAHLEVELEAGKTSIVGGLNLDKANNLDSGVPGLSDIPLLGSLITSKNRNGTKTQTVMLLRATIIPPHAWQSTLVGESL
jgi:MSHA biogenesis protein MshL